MRRAGGPLLAGVACAALLVTAAGAGGRSHFPRKTITFGHSVGGRPLKAVRMGRPHARRTVLVVGQIHGDEPAGRDVVRAVRRGERGFRDVTVWTVVTVNPDGNRAGTRKNAHGVDLNRNFPFRWSGSEPPGSGYYAGPHPLSEPESRAVVRLARRIHPDLSIWFHQPWDAVLACGGGHRVESRFARIARMNTECRGEGLPGTAVSWEEHHFGGSKAFVVEFGSGSLSSGEIRHAAEATAHVAVKGAG